MVTQHLARGGADLALVDERIIARKVRRPGRWVTGGLIALSLALFAYSVTTNPGFQWGIVGKYLFSAPILRGLSLTLGLTVVAMTLGILLGIVLAVMRLSEN